MRPYALVVGMLCALHAPLALALELSPDGAYVIDPRARLAWPRCVEGMQWTGVSCIGEPLRLDHAQAQALALQRWKAEGIRWRLPASAELQRLVDRQARPPGLDPVLFPAAPRGWHWSGSSTVRSGSVNRYSYDNVMRERAGDAPSQLNYLHGWAVDLSSGEATGEASRRSQLPVRLVRPAF